MTSRRQHPRLRLLTRMLAATWLASLAALAAAAAPTIPGLPAEDAALAAIEQDPLLLQARHAVEAARHGAAMQRQGSYEWTVGSTVQRRRADGSPSQREWSAQLERTVRIGGKAELDRRLGDSSEALAQSQWATARIEAALRLLEGWLDWQGARLSEQLLTEQLRLAEENVRAVALRHKAGDAARLDLRLAESDASDMRRQQGLAQTARARAEAALRLHYPGLALQSTPLADPGQLTMPVLSPADIDGHPRLAAASQALEQARLLAQRVRADRMPDPTLGVFTSSEAGGRERVTGISLSIPLSGSYREQAARQAWQQVNVAQSAFDHQRRELELQLSLLAQEVGDSAARWKQSTDTANALQEIAALTQKAYAAGEADVHALLLAQRRALEARSAAQSARNDAMRAHMRLLIETGQVWGLRADGAQASSAE